jgi:cytidine deaminase
MLTPAPPPRASAASAPPGRGAAHAPARRRAPTTRAAAATGTARGAGAPRAPPAAPPAPLPLDTLAGCGFTLPPARVAALMAAHGLGEDALLAALLPAAQALAAPPVSRFRVGAVALGASGALWAGANLEFPGLPLSSAVHAEQALVAAALAGGERALRRVAVSAVPCGHCRQFFSELACAESVRFLLQGGAYSLGQLLPMRFRPSDLLDKEVPLLLEPQLQLLALGAAATAEASRLPGGAAAAAAALAAARGCYAPYSRCPAGVALIMEDGAVFSGGYIESAAYNPSLPPLQAALVAAAAAGRPHLGGVRAAVLVEAADGLVRHGPTTRVALAAIAPGAELVELAAAWEE